MPRPFTRNDWPITRLGAAAQIVLCVAHVITIATGLVYTVAPSASVVKVLDPLWSLVWSLIFVVFGAGCLTFRLLRAWLAEAICMLAVAGGLTIWGAVLIYATVEAGTLGALQVGVRFIGGAVILVGFALLELEWVKLTTGRLTAEMVQQVVNEVSGEIRRRHDDEAEGR